MKNRGQVTIFIIIAILIVAAVALFFTLRGGVEKEKTLSPEIVPIKNFVQECLEETTKEGVYFIGLQGGYYDVPEDFVKISYYSVPIHFYKNRANIPNVDLFQKELGFYIEQNFEECIYNFSSLNLSNTKISAGEPEVKVSVSDDVKVDLIYPLVIEVDESKTLLNEFESFSDFDFNYVYNILEEFKEEQVKNPDYVITGKLLDLAAENNFTYETWYLSDNVVIYSLKLNMIGMKEPYIFSLGAKYDW